MRSSILMLAFLVGGCTDNNLSFNGGDGGNGSDGGPDSGVLGDLAGLDLPAMACDLLAQNCPSGEKCVTMFGGMGGMGGTTTCVAVTGTVGEGGMCMRDMMTGGDNCAAGLICNGGGRGGMGGGVCRKLCGATTDCATKQACTPFGRGGGTAGICQPTCAPFGTDCAAMQTCANITFDIASTQQNPIGVFICRTVGTTPAFGPCMRGTQCAANTYCDNNNICSPLCDTSHACPPAPSDGGGGAALDCQSVGSTAAGDPGVCG